MIAIDTSILARYVLRDSPSEHQAAVQFLSANRCSVSWTVLVELGWVLERSVGLPRNEVIDGIWGIANMEQVSVPDEGKLDWALERFAQGADFADMIHLVAAQGGSVEFATLDKRMERQAGPDTPIAVRTLQV